VRRAKAVAERIARPRPAVPLTAEADGHIGVGTAHDGSRPQAHGDRVHHVIVAHGPGCVVGRAADCHNASRGVLLWAQRELTPEADDSGERTADYWPP
jgi:hypothetical protein